MINKSKNGLFISIRVRYVTFACRRHLSIVRCLPVMNTSLALGILERKVA